MGKVVLDQWNQGGVSDGMFSGAPKSHVSLVGLDLHKKPSVVQAAQVMTKDSGSTVDALCLYAIACSDGNAYFFSSTSGKVWKRTPGGSWSLVYTTSPTAGGAGCLGAYEYNGWIYWATEKYLHRIRVGNTSDWSTYAVPNWRVFTNGSTVSHQMHEVNGVLYIADGFLVAQVSEDTADGVGTISSSSTTVTGTTTNFDPDITVGDKIRFTNSSGQTQIRYVTARSSDTSLTTDTAFSPAASGDIYKFSTHNFTGDALDLPNKYTITCLGNLGTDLLIGTKVNSAAEARVFRWNTWSVSWSDDTGVAEKGVNAFLALNEAVLVSCGTQGNLYQYTGSLQPHKKVPGDYSPSATAIINPQSCVNRNGSLLIGISNLSGNPTKTALWQYGRYSWSYPLVLSTDFPISTNHLSNVEIGAVLMVGDDVFVSWKDSTGGTAYGVDKIDYTAKYSGGYIETMVMAFDRDEMKNFLTFVMDLAAALPDNCSLSLQYKRQHDTTWSDASTEMIELWDSERNAYVMEQGVVAETLQLKITFTTYQNTTPELYDVVIVDN